MKNRPCDIIGGGMALALSADPRHRQACAALNTGLYNYGQIARTTGTQIPALITMVTT